MTCVNKMLFLFLCIFPFVGIAQTSVSRIAFGSCGHQEHPLPVLDVVVKHQPNLFIFLGDNIYGDTRDMNVLREKYQLLGNKPSFQNLKKNVPLIATWDDHDYGKNDAGKEYDFKVESKEIFLDFFNEPKDSERRKHEGIYTSYMYETNGKKLQIILIDNRTFRDNVKPYTGQYKSDKRYFYNLDYAPHTDSTKAFLGEEQWKWLETELSKPADVRIIGSGSQFGIEFNGYEAWANFPHEQKRFLNLIKKTRASGVIFISGDVHYAEISKLNEPGMYPVYDVTSSGLSSTWRFACPNKNRVEGPVMENHFGMISIDWNATVPKIKMEIWDVNDNQRIEKSIELSEISF